MDKTKKSSALKIKNYKKEEALPLKKADLAIEVLEVEKSFRLFSDKAQTLKERILHFNRNQFSLHKVLNGISLNIKWGETVALIGQNGSGKSTLLKLLTGIMYPDKGAIKMNGKVSSLLELGAGFHPDFTGRENIYNNASIFGLSKKEIDQRFDKIVAFSELAEYIDSPVRTYSSGMYMRLAFSVAINVDAEILLIDEILAVGDANFQKKCFDMIKNLKRKGVTIVLVTHDMGSVHKICDRVIWLSDGKIRAEGKPREITDAYFLAMDRLVAKNIKENTISKEDTPVEAVTINPEEKQPVLPCEVVKEKHPVDMEEINSEGFSLEEKLEANNNLHLVKAPLPEEPVPPSLEDALVEYDEAGNKIRWGTGDQIVQKMRVYGSGNFQNKIQTEKVPNFILAGQDLILEVECESKEKVESLVFGIAIKNKDSIICIATNTDLRQIALASPKAGNFYTLKARMKDVRLLKGVYTIDIALHSIEGLPYDYSIGKYTLTVSNTFEDVGFYVPDLEVEYMDRKD